MKIPSLVFLLGYQQKVWRSYRVIEAEGAALFRPTMQPIQLGYYHQSYCTFDRLFNS